MTEMFIYLAVYLLPSFLLGFLALYVFQRNPNKVEHRLLSLFVFGYSILFLAEFVRHLSPIEYSPALIAYLLCSFHIKYHRRRCKGTEVVVPMGRLLTIDSCCVDVCPPGEYHQQSTV